MSSKAKFCFDNENVKYKWDENLEGSCAKCAFSANDKMCTQSDTIVGCLSKNYGAWRTSYHINSARRVEA